MLVNIPKRKLCTKLGTFEQKPASIQLLKHTNPNARLPISAYHKSLCKLHTFIFFFCMQDGKTCLHDAVVGGSIPVISYLLECGLDINATTKV